MDEQTKGNTIVSLPHFVGRGTTKAHGLPVVIWMTEHVFPTCAVK